MFSKEVREQIKERGYNGYFYNKIFSITELFGPLGLGVVPYGPVRSSRMQFGVIRYGKVTQNVFKRNKRKD